MTIQHRSGNSTVEFVLMLSLLTGIGFLIMWLMTDQGSNSGNAIGTGQTAAVTAINND
jgi:hypothetical protein